MKTLPILGFIAFFFIDMLLLLGGLRLLRWFITRCPVASARRCSATDALAHVNRAFASAVRFRIRPPKCLQQAAVTTILLRILGVSANIVIGFREVPMAGHAWVEGEDFAVGKDTFISHNLLIIADRW